MVINEVEVCMAIGALELSLLFPCLQMGCALQLPRNQVCGLSRACLDRRKTSGSNESTSGSPFVLLRVLTVLPP